MFFKNNVMLFEGVRDAGNHTLKNMTEVCICKTNVNQPLPYIIYTRSSDVV